MTTTKKYLYAVIHTSTFLSALDALKDNSLRLQTCYNKYLVRCNKYRVPGRKSIEVNEMADPVINEA